MRAGQRGLCKRVARVSNPVLRIISMVLLRSFILYREVSFINPRRACVARVTVLGVFVCVCVCRSVCLSVCLSTFIHKQQATGNEAAREQYTHLQHNKRSKNNVADLAKTAVSWQGEQAPPWTTFRDPTHQLARCACVFITRLGVCLSVGATLPGVLHCCKCYFKCR